MSFQPTEKSVPAATATTGAPAGAKRSSPWCQATVARGAPKLSTNAAGPRTGKTYGPASRAGLASEGEPKPPNGGGGTSGSPSSAGAAGGAFGREGCFLRGRGCARGGVVGVVAAGGGGFSVGTVGSGSAGGGGGSGATASQTYRWWSYTMTVPSPIPFPESAQIQPFPSELVHT